MPQGQLAQVLRGVLKPADERLLVGPSTVDDAGVVLVGDTNPIALVQTVDYFPPVVDDPYYYGAIAAANSISDVYAMGGQVLSALNLAGFPKDFPDPWITEIFRGGFDKVAEADGVVAGGHTMVTPEPEFGFAFGCASQLFGHGLGADQGLLQQVLLGRELLQARLEASDAVFLALRFVHETLVVLGHDPQKSVDLIRVISAESMGKLMALDIEGRHTHGNRSPWLGKISLPPAESRPEARKT